MSVSAESCTCTTCGRRRCSDPRVTTLSTREIDDRARTLRLLLFDVDGVLTEAQVSRDSPALAAASLPLDLINLLLSPITTLIHGPTPADDGVTVAFEDVA